jgi:hypothetical protein
MLDGDPLQKFISAVSSPETDSRIVGTKSAQVGQVAGKR